MTSNTDFNDDLRGVARRAGYEVIHTFPRCGYVTSTEPPVFGFWITYDGPDNSRRALRDIGPYDNEADAWARAVGLAMACRDGA